MIRYPARYSVDESLRKMEEKRSSLHRFEISFQNSTWIKFDQEDVKEVQHSGDNTNRLSEWQQLLNGCRIILSENSPSLRRFVLKARHNLTQNTSIGEGFFHSLVQGLEQNTTLQALYMSWLGDKVADGIATLLRRGILSDLALIEPAISENCYSFCEALRQDQHLKKLCLCGIGEDSDYILVLLGEFLESNVVLRELVIGTGMEPTNDAFAALANGIARNKGLEVLHLPNCHSIFGAGGESAAQALCHAVSNNPTIKGLTCESCTFNNETARLLFEVGLTTLQSLRLKEVALADEEIETLVKALDQMAQSYRKRSMEGSPKQQPVLQELHLSNVRRMTPRGLCCLLGCLARNPEIPVKKLNLEVFFSSIEDEEVLEATCQLIRSTKTLQRLRYRTKDSKFSKDEFLGLSEAMKCNSTVTYVPSCFQRSPNVLDTNLMRVLYYTRRNRYQIKNLARGAIGLFPLVCVALQRSSCRASARSDWQLQQEDNQGFMSLEWEWKQEAQAESMVPSIITSLVFELLCSNPIICTGRNK